MQKISVYRHMPAGVITITRAVATMIHAVSPESRVASPAKAIVDDAVTMAPVVNKFLSFIFPLHKN